MSVPLGIAVVRDVFRRGGLVVTSLREEGLGFIRLWMGVRGSVRGWLTGTDARALYALAHHGPGRGAIVEVGSAWGRSTVVLAAGSKSARRERVLAIDPHSGDQWYLEDQPIEAFSSLEEFRSNLRRFGVADWVDEIVAASEDAARTLVPMEIRLLYIDGLHTYEAVRRDIADWVPRVVVGGVIVFDDYFNTRDGVGVHAAVDDLLASGDVEATLRRADRLVWTTKVRRPAPPSSRSPTAS